jgi:hypothetical protein
MKAIQVFLSKRQGKGISDEDEEAYCVGFNDALEALLSDAVYYGAALSPGEFRTLEEAVEFVRDGDVEVGLT